MTRSIAPFFSTRTPVPNLAICRSPARTTASIAVARNCGSGLPAVALAEADHASAFWSFLTIRISMPPGDFLQHRFVHEVANEEDPAAARLEDVFGRQRIGHFFRHEPLALVFDANHELVGRRRRHRAELDDDALVRIVLVAMLDRVDHRLAHRDADPVQLIFVEARRLADVIGDDLHEIEHVEGAEEFDADRVRWNHLVGGPTVPRRGMCWLSTIALSTRSSSYS